MKKIEIVSRGRVMLVSGAQLDQLRSANISWYAYCQKRLTLSHDSAVLSLAKR